MTTGTLSQDATIADVLATLARAESYVRGMLENMYECKREHGNAVARIGITGGGVAPNYRIEFERNERVERQDKAIGMHRSRGSPRKASIDPCRFTASVSAHRHHHSAPVCEQDRRRRSSDSTLLHSSSHKRSIPCQSPSAAA
jgi:hypothetical protein